mgnify:CR=1 FL=1
MKILQELKKKHYGKNKMKKLHLLLEFVDFNPETGFI